MAYADIQTRQRLAGHVLDPLHFHPELTLVMHSFTRRRRSEQWILTDNGTVPLIVAYVLQIAIPMSRENHPF